MKIFKLYGNNGNNSTFSLQGIKTLYDDGVARNDIQTAMAVIQWISTIDNVIGWLWDNDAQLCWDDGTSIKF